MRSHGAEHGQTGGDLSHMVHLQARPDQRMGVLACECTQNDRAICMRVKRLSWTLEDVSGSPTGARMLLEMVHV